MNRTKDEIKNAPEFDENSVPRRRGLPRTGSAPTTPGLAPRINSDGRCRWAARRLSRPVAGRGRAGHSHASLRLAARNAREQLVPAATRLDSGHGPDVKLPRASVR